MSALKPTVTTTLSTKGQVILPKAVRESRGWKPGDRLNVEEIPGGLLLTLEGEAEVARTRMEDVYGMFKHKGPPVTLEQMRQAAEEGAAERYLRSSTAAPDER